NDPVPRREPPRRGLDSGRILRDDQAVRSDAPRELGMGSRVIAVDAAAEDRDRRATALERAAVSLSVDSARHAADDEKSGARQLATERACNVRAVCRARARTDDRYCRPVEERRVGRTAEKEPGRRVEDRRQCRRKARLRAADPPDAGAGEPLPERGLVEA